MDTLSIVLIFGPIVAFAVWICSRVLQKAGFSGWWCVLVVVPVVNIVGLWVFSFVRWPVLEDIAVESDP